MPQGVTASAASTTQIVVSWQASTDAGTGVAGYRVFRNGAANAVATASGTSFTDGGLTPATQYSYTVSAFDGANPANESAHSAAAVATTQATTPIVGLDARPDNTTCVAGDRPSQVVTLATERAFPNLPAFSSPVLMLQAPGDATHWFVVEQGGTVRVFDNQAGVASSGQFVDITSRVRSGGEQGLLGMAFHPGYPADPRVYLSYTNATNGLVSRISEFRTRDGGLTLDPTSELILLTVAQPATNHNGGNIAFGPDGLLYVGFGDGGSGGDPWGAIGNGQNLTTLLGKLLRIDVNGSTGNVPYRIPPANPYAGNALCNAGTGTQSCPEIYAYGLRNPWRWSFDRGSGELWVADVGQNAIEEVDRVVPGGNYGWRCFEGTQAYNSTCGPNAGSSLPPIAQYTHAYGQSITGGYVYRGAAIPALAGRYVFGDFVSGRIWHIARNTRADASGHRRIRQWPVDRVVRAGHRRRTVRRALRRTAVPTAGRRGQRRLGAEPAVGHRLRRGRGCDSSRVRPDPVRAQRSVLVGRRRQGTLSRAPERHHDHPDGGRRFRISERHRADEALPPRRTAGGDAALHAALGRRVGRLHV